MFMNIIRRIDPVSAITGAIAGATTVGIPLGIYASHKAKDCKALKKETKRLSERIEWELKKRQDAEAAKAATEEATEAEAATAESAPASKPEKKNGKKLLVT